MVTPGARFAVCEQVLRLGSFADDVTAAKKAGVNAIAVDADAVDAIGVDEARRILDGEGVQVSSYIALGTILEDRRPLLLTDTVRRLDVAARLGAPGALVITGTTGRLTEAEADAVCREWLFTAGAVADGCGVRIMLEPMHPIMRQYTYVHTFRHALSLVDGAPGTGVVFDFGHLWWEDGLDRLVRENIDAIVSVQLTNVDAAALDDLRYERGPLGIGDVPVTRLVDLFEASGYDGWYEHEVIARMPRERRLELVRTDREWFEHAGEPGGSRA